MSIFEHCIMLPFRWFLLGTMRCNFRRFRSVEKHPASEYSDVRIVTEDNVKLAAYLVKPRVVDENTLFFVVCHGIGSNQYTHASVCGNGEALGGKNVCVLFANYREFGSSKGKFTVKGASRDIHACLRYMRDTLQAEDVHLYGHSLGGAIVLEYIRHAQVSGIARLHSKVILKSTFTCFADAFREYFERRGKLVSSRMHEFIEKHFRYNSLENITYANAKDVLIVHSDKDELVSKEHAVKLGEKIGVEPVILSGTHNSTAWSPAAWKCILEFVLGRPMRPVHFYENPAHSASLSKTCTD